MISERASGVAVDPWGLGEDATAPCGPPRHPACPGAGLCVSCPRCPPPRCPTPAVPQEQWSLGLLCSPGRSTTVQAVMGRQQRPTARARPALHVAGLVASRGGLLQSMTPSPPGRPSVMRLERPGGPFWGVGHRACPRGPWAQARVWTAPLPGRGACPPHLNGWDEQAVSGTGCSQLSPGADPRCGTRKVL